MKASEALKISYRIARDVPGEIRQCAISDDGFVKHFVGTNGVRNCTLDEVDRWLRGDDWQPLLPAVPIEELPIHTATFGTNYGMQFYEAKLVLLSDLQSIVPARACDCSARIKHCDNCGSDWADTSEEPSDE